MVLATPGTSSISRCPSASQTAVAKTTCSCLPTMTFSTLATSCFAMDETSAVVSDFGSSTGGKVIFGFLSGFGKGISMRLIFHTFADDTTHFLQRVCFVRLQNAYVRHATFQRQPVLISQFVHGFTMSTLQCAWSLMRSAVSPKSR